MAAGGGFDMAADGFRWRRELAVERFTPSSSVADGQCSEVLRLLS